MEKKGNFNPTPPKTPELVSQLTWDYKSPGPCAWVLSNAAAYAYAKVSCLKQNYHKTKNVKDKVEATIALLDVTPLRLIGVP